MERGKWSKANLLRLCAGHDYDASGVFATDPKKPPGPGRAIGF